MIRPLLCLQIVGLVRLLGAKDEKCPPYSSTLHRVVLIWDLVLVVCDPISDFLLLFVTRDNLDDSLKSLEAVERSTLFTKVNNRINFLVLFEHQNCKSCTYNASFTRREVSKLPPNFLRHHIF